MDEPVRWSLDDIDRELNRLREEQTEIEHRLGVRSSPRQPPRSPPRMLGDERALVSGIAAQKEHHANSVRRLAESYAFADSHSTMHDARHARHDDNLAHVGSTIPPSNSGYCMPTSSWATAPEPPFPSTTAAHAPSYDRFSPSSFGGSDPNAYDRFQTSRAFASFG
eukprot:6177280-Pleurochrysis_carterae.AAC.2